MKNILIVLLVVIGFSASAQEVYTSSGRPVGSKRKEDKRKKEKDGFSLSRLVVGGTLGFGMGDNVIAFNVAPMVGYRITDKLAAGVGFGYQYYKAKDYLEITNPITNETKLYDLKANMISASVWARYLVFDRLFVHAEYEHNFYTYQDYRFSQSGTGDIEAYKLKLDVPCLLLGVGYRQPVSENASVYILGFYDVLQRELSPYYGAIQPRIGFTIGF